MHGSAWYEQAGTDPATGTFFVYFVYFVVTTPAAHLPRIWYNSTKTIWKEGRTMKRGAFQSLLLAAGLIAVFCETAWAHFPISVEPKANDGLLPLDFFPVQVGLCPSLQMVHGKADTVVSVGALSLRQNSALASVALENSVANNYLAQAGFIAVSGFNYAFEVGFLSLASRNIGISAGVFNVESNFGYRGGDPYPWLPGLQVGLVNAGGGIQIGLLNYNPQGFLPWFPIINFPCGGEW